ncbi:MAG: threonylcarbamoyl-AMP synthase [Clostridia bacterium]|nr:threonylcarbamoyl-AMP synthase [Clostridia bacterium]
MKTQLLQPNNEGINTASALLKSGEVVGIPTETVYGLAADAMNVDAIKKIYEAKGRPSDNPLIVHISKFEELFGLVESIPQCLKLLADKFWPGPLTMIFERKDTVPKEVAPNLNTVAVRMPSHPIARAVIEASGTPLAAPSANLSGSPSPTTASHVMNDMDGRIPAVLDGGECEVGVESTVLFVANGKPRLLRPGGITVEQIESVIGEIDIDPSVVSDVFTENVASPGMKYKHYSPKAKVIVVDACSDVFASYVNKYQNEDNIYALCFDEDIEKLNIPYLAVGSKDTQGDYAKALFSALRDLDDKGAKVIYAHCPDKSGIGLAVYNRLIRAAAFKVITPKPYCVLGLTGTTGAGKSTLSEHFKTLGGYIIDCDIIARDVLQRKDVIENIVSAFGDVLEDGKICRKKLASVAFSSKENSLKLNSITHPAIIDEIKSQLEMRENLKTGLTVIDAPLLFEANLEKLCDVTLAVTASKDVRLSRIMKRDNIDKESALLRINVQNDDSIYSQKATYTVINDGEENEFIFAADQIINDIGVIINGK